MKNVLGFLLIIILFTGCDQEKYGSLRQKVRYTTDGITGSLKSMSITEERYTQFGDFITSITPDKLIAEVEIIQFQSDNEYGSSMTLLRPEPNDPLRFADFSGNATISTVPILNGTNMMENLDGQGGYYRQDVTFDFLWITLLDIKQEVALPAQYTAINLLQFKNYNVVKNNNILTIDFNPLLQMLPDFKDRFGGRLNMYFGRTDTTAVYYGAPANFPQIGNPHNFFIWSENFTEWVISPPPIDQTVTMLSTIGFDSQNLIQVYAGIDNIPYTEDDIIVFAPKFWERFYAYVSDSDE